MVEQLKSSPIVPVFYHSELENARQIVAACFAAGLRFFEFTTRGKEALAVFAELVVFSREHCPGLSLGIGTIYTAAEAEQFLAAGADFVVQPVTTDAVGAVCRDHSKPWIPGALTPNEIWTAWQSGASVVKLFPGNSIDPDYIRALRGPMPNVPFLVTGGVEPAADSINEWLDAGVQAVGIGSKLFQGAFSSDFPALTRHIAGLLKAVRKPSTW